MSRVGLREVDPAALCVFVHLSRDHQGAVCLDQASHRIKWVQENLGRKCGTESEKNVPKVKIDVSLVEDCEPIEIVETK